MPDKQKSEIQPEVEEQFVRFLNRGEQPTDYERKVMEEHLDRVLYILEGGSPPPYELEIQPASKCNAKCDHCFAQDYEPLPEKIGPDEMREIAGKVAKFQEDGFEVETAKFCGTTGDPLVKRVTADGIRIFKELGKKVIVYTNGLLLDRHIGRDGELYLDIILSADKLNLSLDAGCEDTHFAIKGIPGFERIIDNTGLMVQRRAQRQSSTYIVVSYVITQKNYGDVVEAARRAQATGADEIRYRVDFTNPEQIREISDTVLKRIQQAGEYATSSFKVISAYSPKGISETDEEFNTAGRKCYNHHFWGCIGPDAQLYACGHRTHGGVVSYGSLLEHSFEELWHSEPRLASVRELPGEHCDICSPSSSRRNDFMTWLSQIPVESVKALHAKYVAE